MRRVRNVMFVVLVAVAVFASSRGILADSSGCEPFWQDNTGYSLICNTWPEAAVCWSPNDVYDACWDWCWNYNGQGWLPWVYGCETEGYYQMEIYCGCWNPY